MTDCHDKLSLSCQWLSAESKLIYVPVLLLLWSLRFLTADRQERPCLKHTADRLTSDLSHSLQLRLLQLSAHQGIMNDSEWWNRRSLCSSGPCLKKPKCGPPRHREHYLLKTFGQTKQCIHHQSHESDLTSGWAVKQMTVKVENRWDHQWIPPRSQICTDSMPIYIRAMV